MSLKLDAHIPEGPGPFPAVILVHGGGWAAGHKTVNFVKDLFPVLDQTGMAWFTIDYRLAPQHPYPEALQDVEAAVAWVKKNARHYKVNQRRIALGVRHESGGIARFVFYGPFLSVVIR